MMGTQASWGLLLQNKPVWNYYSGTYKKFFKADEKIDT